MTNKCEDCRYANWRGLEFYENAECSVEKKVRYINKDGYVTFCSEYRPKNIFKVIWIWLNK